MAGVWLSVGLLGLLLDSDVATSGHDAAIVVLSTASLLFGVWVFWCHGGPAITAAGIYNFAFALFVGFAGLHLVAYPGEVTPELLVPALAWAYFGHVATWLLFWSAPAPAPTPASGARPADDRAVRRTATRLGVLLVASMTLLSIVYSGEFTPVVQGASFVGAVLVAVGLLGGGPSRTWLTGGVAAALALLANVSISTGYGRLNLGALGFAMLIVATRQVATRLVKVAVLAATAPVLMGFASMRDSNPGTLTADVRGTNGLESVISPLVCFARLLHYSETGVLARHGFDTFWAALVAMVPRAAWPEKPVGFGAEMVYVLHPELAGSGHSDAALFNGEWVYGFGVVGLVAMVPITGVVLRAVDRRLRWVSARPLADRRSLLVYVATIIVAAGVPDLAWGGTFIYVARAEIRLLVLVAAGVLLWSAIRAGARPRAVGRTGPDRPRAGLGVR
jgi:hypothetical protein